MVQTAKITKLSRKMARQQPRINEEKEKVTNAKKKIAELNKNMLESNYGKYCFKLNVIFNSFNTDVKKILKDKNIKSRTKKITFQDALAYMFLYNQIDRTKDNVIGDLFKNYELDISRQSLDSKFRLIPVEAIELLFNKICDLTKEYNITEDELKFIAVDGTYNNTNDNRENGKIQTSLNMAYFDVNSLVPLEIKYNTSKKKNHEVKELKERLELNNIKNAVLILDRAYYDKNLMLKLAEKKCFLLLELKIIHCLIMIIWKNILKL